MYTVQYIVHNNDFKKKSNNQVVLALYWWYINGERLKVFFDVKVHSKKVISYKD